MVRPLFLSLLILVAVAFPLLRAEPPGADDVRVADFIKALKSDNAGVRKQVALALGDLGEKAKSAIPALRDLLLDSDKDVQVAAARALGQISNDKLVGDKTLEEARPRAEADRDKLVRLTVELTARSREVDDLSKKLREYEVKTLSDGKTTTELQLKLVNAQVEGDLLKKRLAALEDRLRELEKAPKPEKAPEPKNPPGEQVEGTVKMVDDNSGVVLVTIGSDAGLRKGHTLEVFRLNPPKYVGTIRVLEVKPTEAACKPINQLLSPIVPGDRVASKLLGN
jgi:uncharacterized coiled-coil protein SlyX